MRKHTLVVTLPIANRIMPRDTPRPMLMTAFFSSARKCASAALGERKPKCVESSDLVGGNLLFSMNSEINLRTSFCLAVSLFAAIFMHLFSML